MRVITGKAKKTKLISLDYRTVPLSDRAKSALFEIIHEKIHGSRVLDLYAGSGALGIEALSRGAEHATFIDISYKAIDSIKQNLQRTHLEEQGSVVRFDVENFLQNENNEKYDLIFFSPPYPEVKFYPLKLAAQCLNAYGILVFEHSKKDSFKELKDLEKIDTRTYGRVMFELYQNI